jgi:hypothetical protein
MSVEKPRPQRRVRFAPLALAFGVVGAAVLGFSSTGTFSAFTASITNSANDAATGSLVMKETDSAGTAGTQCLSSSGTNNTYASCSTLNTFGAAVFTPGTTNTTTVRIYNTGTTPANGFTLSPGSCSYSGSGTATDVCSKLTLTVTCVASTGGTASTVFPSGTLAAFATGGTIAIPSTAAACVPPAGGAAWVNFTFAVTLASGVDNTYQGLTAAQPITWTFTS